MRGPVEAPKAKAKVVVVGDTGVGKRSLVRRSSIDPYSDRYLDLLGARVSKREIVPRVRLREGGVGGLIWGTAGAGARRAGVGRGRPGPGGFSGFAAPPAATAWPTWWIS